jgi:hypothetical protein
VTSSRPTELRDREGRRGIRVSMSLGDRADAWIAAEDAEAFFALQSRFSV